MSVVELDRVTKSFGSVTAVDDVSITLAEGESLVALGPSGSGKSTLLRIIAGLESADSGEIRIGGVLQNDLPPHRRDVAIVFQHFALYPHLSALDNITLGLRHGLGLARAEARHRAFDVAQRLEIDALLGRRPREMSGGQRQRVALARALARRSNVVLLDEPLSGLDAQLRLSLRAEIAGVLGATGATTVHVTHDQNDAMALADRIAVISGGQLQQLGTPDDLYRRPASTFVASFVGAPPMNLFDVPAVDGGLRTPFGIVRSRRSTAVQAGIRPEQLRIGSSSATWTADARIQVVEPEGPSTIVHMALGDLSMCARVHPDVKVAVGDEVEVGCEPADIHVFDPVDGRSLGLASEVL
ncbi:ABC transporter ATP-binding protein [Pseudonocardia sp. NPDC046786]|uniref:ABC transporter ATP-binding protein n=1 Tax=Pseudonocardia sp. NPDC046786 TaxID=3155471 RepID=UPI0033C6B2D5